MAARIDPRVSASAWLLEHATPAKKRRASTRLHSSDLRSYCDLDLVGLGFLT